MKTKTRRSPSARLPRGASRSRRTPASATTLELMPVLMKLKSVLVPVDFSDPSGKAFDYAISFARQFGAKLSLLYVVEPVATPDFSSFPLVIESEQLSRSARQKLQTLCDKRKLGSDVVERIEVRHGRAYHEICEAARSTKADLVILSTHGYTGVKHVLLGSTAERVVRYAPCPVLVVRQHERQFA